MPFVTKFFVVAGALNAFLAVGCGAFGAHALGDRLGERLLEAWQTGAQYHLVHAVALVAVAALMGRGPASAGLLASGGLLLAGQLLFAGSLYALALSGVRWLGAITPVGGMLLLAGWLALALTAARVP